MIISFEGFPEMYVLCNIYRIRNPVGLVWVLAWIIESWTGHYQHLWGFLVLLMLRVCVSTAAAELDIKYFCPMKYFCVLSPWCSFSANLVRSISPHRMHFRFWFKRYVIAGILPAKMRPRTNIFHAKKAKSHNSFALPLCSANTLVIYN